MDCAKINMLSISKKQKVAGEEDVEMAEPEKKKEKKV